MTGAAAALAAWLVAWPAVPEDARLPSRVRRIVLHVLGGPDYSRPERRWSFLDPPATQALWRRSFGAHWIVWTDGSLWPRHPRPGSPASVLPPVQGPADDEWRRRLASEARHVYSHVHLGNSASIGIEVAHSGRSDVPLPEVQARSLAWLVRTLLEMSHGRLAPRDVVGHKDLDRRRAYTRPGCERPGCPVFVDPSGRPYRRRVDPPELLFRALADHGLSVPRPSADGDFELRRAEAVPSGERPEVAPR